MRPVKLTFSKCSMRATHKPSQPDVELEIDSAAARTLGSAAAASTSGRIEEAPLPLSQADRNAVSSGNTVTASLTTAARVVETTIGGGCVATWKACASVRDAAITARLKPCIDVDDPDGMKEMQLRRSFSERNFCGMFCGAVTILNLRSSYENAFMNLYPLRILLKPAASVKMTNTE